MGGTAETTAAGATTIMGAMAVTIAETTIMEETTITEEVDPGAAAAVATDPAGPPTDPPTQDGGTAEAAEILSVPEVTEGSASHRSNSSTKPHCFVIKYIHKNNASD